MWLEDLWAEMAIRTENPGWLQHWGYNSVGVWGKGGKGGSLSIRVFFDPSMILFFQILSRLIPDGNKLQVTCILLNSTWAL